MVLCVCMCLCVVVLCVCVYVCFSFSSIGFFSVDFLSVFFFGSNWFNDFSLFLNIVWFSIEYVLLGASSMWIVARGFFSFLSSYAIVYLVCFFFFAFRFVCVEWMEKNCKHEMNVDEHVVNVMCECGWLILCWLHPSQLTRLQTFPIHFILFLKILSLSLSLDCSVTEKIRSSWSCNRMDATIWQDACQERTYISLLCANVNLQGIFHSFVSFFSLFFFLFELDRYLSRGLTDKHLKIKEKKSTVRSLNYFFCFKCFFFFWIWDLSCLCVFSVIVFFFLF